jgi:hypothetical protein
VPAYETELQLGKHFGDNLQGGSDSVFGDDYESTGITESTGIITESIRIVRA